MPESLVDIKEDVRLLKKDMWYGNGKPGLTTRMAQVEKYIESQTWLLRSLLVAVLGDIVMRVFRH